MDSPLPESLVSDWESLLSAPVTTDSDGAFDSIFRHDVLFPLQRRRELVKMLDCARTIDPKVVVEIGADKGGSFFHWADLVTVTTAIAVEIRGTPYIPVMQEFFHGMELVGIPDSSYAQSTVNQIQRTLDGRKIDCAFLDGDKSKFDVDFELILPMMRSGGFVFMHDIHGEAEPVRVLNRLESKYRVDRIIDVSEGVEALARKAAGIKADSSYEGWLRYWNTTSCGVGVIHVP